MSQLEQREFAPVQMFDLRQHPLHAGGQKVRTFAMRQESPFSRPADPELEETPRVNHLQHQRSTNKNKSLIFKQWVALFCKIVVFIFIFTVFSLLERRSIQGFFLILVKMRRVRPDAS